MASPDVLVIDSRLPEPDRDAGSLRMFNLLLVLGELSGRLRFAARAGFQAGNYSRMLGSAGVRLVNGPAGDYLQRTQDNCDIAILSRPENASGLIEPLRRKYPGAKIIFDTVDLHHLRLYREARQTGNANALRQALAYKKQETALARAADCNLVVSAYEGGVLAELCPGADIRVVSLIYNVIPGIKGFEERRDFFFSGSFTHRPNIDAVLFYAAEIHPLIRENLAGVRCHIIGENPPAEVLSLESADLIFEGFVPEMEPFLENCRLSIAPLRYGAGVKGKVLLSMSRGLPVVGTVTAAEGIPGDGREGMLRVDSAREFCSALERLYTDREMWEGLSEGGMNIIRDHFSPEAARSTLAGLFRNFGF